MSKPNGADEQLREEEGQWLSATDYLIANVPRRTAKTFLAATLVLCELANNPKFRSGSVRLEGNKLAVEIKMRRRRREGEKRHDSKPRHSPSARISEEAGGEDAR